MEDSKHLQEPIKNELEAALRTCILLNALRCCNATRMLFSVPGGAAKMMEPSFAKWLEKLLDDEV